jgi:oligopeptide transport system substrate-binding protein
VGFPCDSSVLGQLPALEGSKVNGRSWSLFGAALLVAGTLLSCSNSPYKESDDLHKVLYRAYSEPPKTLDPAVAYSTADQIIVAEVYDTLLEYHYFERPYRLIPGMATAVPSAEYLADGRVRYTFSLRPGLHYAPDVCFGLAGSREAGSREAGSREAGSREAGSREAGSREVSAEDFVFALSRLADPLVASPVVEPFGHLVGFAAFGKALEQRRARDAAFAKLPADQQYRTLGGFDGARAEDERTLSITLSAPYPQLLYWFAMNFASPVPPEAVRMYDGQAGRPDFAEHPVGSGPFRLSAYEKHSRMVLSRHEGYYGLHAPAGAAPGATFPAADARATDADRAAAGRPLPFLDRVEYRLEKENIPAFGKFLQGYYDISGIARESFDKVISERGLSEEMQSLGMSLTKSVVPAVYYIGFNLDDPVVGRAGGERSRLLRQAMSLATDVQEYLRLFANGRGIPAQSPLPPGIFGYEEEYQNPHRAFDLERAKALLVQAGFPGGIDAKTGRPLRLTFDVPDTSPEGRLRFQFWVKRWRQLGLDVVLEATNYNKFQEKVRDGAYQIFQWGWVADYPDPENFLFLLTTRMARSESGGPNSANFKDAEYDRLFSLMQARENDGERQQLIRSMRTILERERPWIELFHPEDYALTHGWLSHVRPPGLSIPTVKYHDVDPKLRTAQRRAWNRPIVWPAFALICMVLLLIAPGVLTYYRERQ